MVRCRELMERPKALALSIALFAALAGLPVRAPADELLSALAPDASFMQLGGGMPTQTFTIGLLWRSDWRAALGKGEVSLHVEASIGRWWTREDGLNGSAWITQAGLTPTLRYRWDGGRSAWFAEAGIGANVLTPIFRDGRRQFSTAFNFGDHIALGRSFGPARNHEIAIRLQHFSNAGLKHPNPGITFEQLRYALWF
jgi:lipid A 3-O-deacylase